MYIIMFIIKKIKKNKKTTTVARGLLTIKMKDYRPEGCDLMKDYRRPVDYHNERL